VLNWEKQSDNKMVPRYHGAERIALGLIIGVFIFLTAQKLSYFPSPWKDEPWLMQPAYEVLQHGRNALPMFRHKGYQVGEHVLTDPVFTYLLGGWFKVWGFGMLQARAFNLTASVVILLVVYRLARLVGKFATDSLDSFTTRALSPVRHLTTTTATTSATTPPLAVAKPESSLNNRLIEFLTKLLTQLLTTFSPAAITGLLAVCFLVTDSNYFTASRFLRNDFLSVAFALLAANFYWTAQTYRPMAFPESSAAVLTTTPTLDNAAGRKSSWYLFCAGLSTALAILSHLNAIYLFAVLGLWILVDEGLLFFLRRAPWLVAAGMGSLLLPYAGYCYHYREIYIKVLQRRACGKTSRRKPNATIIGIMGF
jgi:hypothetical protein